jgi:hypothetical protein
MAKIQFSPAKILLSLAAVFFLRVAAPGQTIIENFPGINLTDCLNLGAGFTPPDTIGAAGTNHFVEFVNGAVAVYNKAGVRQSLTTDSNFWVSAGINPAILSAGLTAPRVAFDAGSGRWFASEITTSNTANSVLLARSDFSDPTGTWQAVSFLGNSGYADFDTLGVDSLGVYVGVNDFSSAAGFGTGVSFFSIPKTDLLAATPTIANMTRFDNLNDQTYGLTLQGVCNSDAGAGHGVIIAIDNESFNFIDRTTINGPGAADATLSTPARIAIADDSYPNPATQPGGAMVDALDDSFPSAVRQIGGYIFMANTILQGSKDAVHWVVINETNNNVVGENIISDPSYDFFQPSIAASHNGTILMTFNRCGTVSPAGDIGIYAAVGSITNGTVTMGAPFVLKAGTVSNFTISFDPHSDGYYSWGDYSATMLDPTDDNLLWAIQEIPTSATSWGTQITLISMATVRPTLAINVGGANVNLFWPASTDPGYVLQSNTNLANTSSWITLTNVPTVSSNQNLVTLSLTNQSAYFRLKK